MKTKHWKNSFSVATWTFLSVAVALETLKQSHTKGIRVRFPEGPETFRNGNVALGKFFDGNSDIILNLADKKSNKSF